MKTFTSLLGVVSLLVCMIIFSSCPDISDIIDDITGTEHETGDTLWFHANTVEKTAIAKPLAYHNNTLYYGIAGGTLWWTAGRIVALDTEDGSIKWTSGEIDNIHVSQILVEDDGTVYTVGAHKLFSINPSNGSFNWEWEVPQELPNPDGNGNVYTYGTLGAMALTNSGNIVLGSVGSGAYYRGIYCISKDGIKLWHNLKANGGSVHSGISIGKNDQMFYYSSPEHLKIMCLNTESGTILWSKQIQAMSSSENHIIVRDDGNILCSYKALGEDKFKFRQLDAANGNVLWTSTDESNGYGYLTSKNGTIYQWGLHGLHYYDPNAGVATQFTDLARGRVCAIDNNSNIYLATNINSTWSLGVFDANGNVDWSNNMNGLVGEPYIISDEKVIYAVVDQNGSPSRLPQNIIAIQGENRLASSGWPKQWHDNRNTSNVNK